MRILAEANLWAYGASAARPRRRQPAGVRRKEAATARPRKPRRPGEPAPGDSLPSPWQAAGSRPRGGYAATTGQPSCPRPAVVKYHRQEPIACYAPDRCRRRHATVNPAQDGVWPVVRIRPTDRTTMPSPDDREAKSAGIYRRISRSDDGQMIKDGSLRCVETRPA